MMPVVLHFNADSCPDGIADIAVALGEDVKGLSKVEAAKRAAPAIRKLAKAVGLPTTLAEYGADPQLIGVCSEFAAKDGDLPENPIATTIDQMKDFYKQAFEENPD
jgi:alcohol dehydrogenase class IV